MGQFFKLFCAVPEQSGCRRKTMNILLYKEGMVVLWNHTIWILKVSCIYTLYKCSFVLSYISQQQNPWHKVWFEVAVVNCFICFLFKCYTLKQISNRYQSTHIQKHTQCNCILESHHQWNVQLRSICNRTVNKPLASEAWVDDIGL